MCPIDAITERFEAVEILGIPGLFTALRVDRATVPKGMYLYEMQTNEEDWSQPGLIGRHITVEHYGTVLTASPIELSATGYRDLHPGDFDQGSGAERLTVAEFEEKYLSPKPAPRPTHRQHSQRKDHLFQAPAR